MGLPVVPNTTCDIYRSANAPPAAPDVAAVQIQLLPAFAESHRTGTSSVSTWRWTHVAIVPLEVDIRDPYIGGGPTGETAPAGNQDSIWVPDKNGTQLRVMFVERVGYGTPHDHKRVYLMRQSPSWPTNNL
jgi:hypothetical protein